MRKFLSAGLAVATVFYFLLTGYNGRVDTTVPKGVAPPQVADSGDTPVEHGEELSDLPRAPDTRPPGSQTSPLFDKYVAPALISGRTIPVAADLDERIATLRRLADHNRAQLYAVLWQILEVEEIEDTEFHRFILATLEERGDNAPGEILAALVQTAATPELRKSALRLLSEASQELSIDSFNQALEDQDPAIRRTALAFFDGLSANALLDAVAGAVLDRNRAVRLIAFSTLEEMYKFAPVWEVADLVVDDPDPQIRMRALELLTYGDRPAAIGRLALALGDPNPRVSELAGALLAELEQDQT